MGDRSKIGWTDATWNPVTGCSRVSPGCEHCYAEALAVGRLRGRPGYPGLPWTAQNAATNVVLHPDRLNQPLLWKAPRGIFVNSMSDLFHERVPEDFLDSVFETIVFADWHRFMILSKRAARMRDYISGAWGRIKWRPALSGHYVELGAGWPRDNVWLGVSCEDQRRADERIPLLRDTLAALRFVSFEPLLGPIGVSLAHIDWVIIGGESGPHARPMEIDWLYGLVNQCRAAGVKVWVKQDSGRWPGQRGRIPDDLWVQEVPQ